MNFIKLLDMMDFSKIDQDEVKSVGARRGFMKKAGQYSVKAALATLPAMALTMMPKIVKAQSGGVIKTLNFALLLEYLERDFYKMALDAPGLIPGSDRAIFNQIYK